MKVISELPPMGDGKGEGEGKGEGWGDGYHMSKPLVRVFSQDHDRYPIVFRNARVKQKGVCYSCRKPIMSGQRLATKFTKTTRYYHEECAYRINLLAKRRLQSVKK